MTNCSDDKEVFLENPERTNERMNTTASIVREKGSVIYPESIHIGPNKTITVDDKKGPQQKEFIRDIIAKVMVDDPEVLQSLSDTLNSRLAAFIYLLRETKLRESSD